MGEQATQEVSPLREGGGGAAVVRRVADRRKVKVLVVADHRLVAEGLAALLRTYAELDVVGSVASVTRALAAVQRGHPDVVLVDSEAGPGGIGPQAAVEVRTCFPEISVVFVGPDDTDESVGTAVAAGALGYVPKSASADEVAEAVARAADGETLIPAPRLARLLAGRGELARARAEQARALCALTPRERQILELLTEGLDNRAIARRLNIGYSTVRSHVRRLLQKLGVHTQLEAVVKATHPELRGPERA